MNIIYRGYDAKTEAGGVVIRKDGKEVHRGALTEDQVYAWIDADKRRGWVAPIPSAPSGRK